MTIYSMGKKRKDNALDEKVLMRQPITKSKAEHEKEKRKRILELGIRLFQLRADGLESDEIRHVMDSTEWGLSYLTKQLMAITGCLTSFQLMAKLAAEGLIKINGGGMKIKNYYFDPDKECEEGNLYVTSFLSDTSPWTSPNIAESIDKSYQESEIDRNNVSENRYKENA